MNFTATPQWANVTKTLNSTVGIAIGYMWYLTNNKGNPTNTDIFTLNTTAASTEVIRYVDPDATGSANGTSWTNAYNNLSDWEDKEDTNLVTDGNWHHVYVRSSGGTADTVAVTISGWTTGRENYILIEAASGDEAVKTGWDTNRYRLEVTDARAIDIQEDYVRVDGLQIKLTSVDTNNVHGINVVLVGTGDIRISNCRIDGDISGTSTGNHGIQMNDADATMKIWNCIVTGFINGANTQAGYRQQVGGTVEIYNSIFYGNNIGIYEWSGTSIIKNNAVFNNTDDVSGGDTEDYNANDDGETGSTPGQHTGMAAQRQRGGSCNSHRRDENRKSCCDNRRYECNVPHL